MDVFKEPSLDIFMTFSSSEQPRKPLRPFDIKIGVLGLMNAGGQLDDYRRVESNNRHQHETVNSNKGSSEQRTNPPTLGFLLLFMALDSTRSEDCDQQKETSVHRN